MARIGINFRTKESLGKKLKDTLLDLFGKKVRDNFADLRPFIEEAISDGVINSSEEFQATDNEAHELGIGDGIGIDRSKSQEAWRQLLPSSKSHYISFTIKKTSVDRFGKLGTITISVDKDAFLDDDLCKIETEKGRILPWMDWLINGAPLITTHAYLPKPFTNGISRSGRGIMIKGGIWSFAPSKPFAFEILAKQIDFQVVKTVRKNIGSVFNSQGKVV